MHVIFRKFGQITYLSIFFHVILPKKQQKLIFGKAWIYSGKRQHLEGGIPSSKLWYVKKKHNHFMSCNVIILLTRFISFYDSMSLNMIQYHIKIFTKNKLPLPGTCIWYKLNNKLWYHKIFYHMTWYKILYMTYCMWYMYNIMIIHS